MRMPRTLPTAANLSSDYTVTLTVNGRPQYLRRALRSLSAVRGIERWHLVIALEPGSADCADLCRSVDFMPVTILENERRLGVRGNPFHVLGYVFERGSRLNVYLEDDLIVSPDIAELALWYEKLVPLDTLDDFKIVFLSLFVTSIGVEPEDEIVADLYFSPWGLILNRSQWFEQVAPHWWNDEHPFGAKDWTWSLTARLGAEVAVLAPRLSRTANIGREAGVHADPERHDLLVHGLAMHRSAKPVSYRLNRLEGVRWRKLNYETMTIDGF